MFELEFNRERVKVEMHKHDSLKLLKVVVALLGLDSLELELLNTIRNIHESREEFRKVIEDMVTEYMNTLQEIADNLSKLSEKVDAEIEEIVDNDRLIKECFGHLHKDEEADEKKRIDSV